MKAISNDSLSYDPKREFPTNPDTKIIPLYPSCPLVPNNEIDVY